MIDLEFIERLIRVFDDSGVDSLEIEHTGTRVSLSKTPPYGGATSVGIAAPVPVPVSSCRVVHVASCRVRVRVRVACPML